MKVYCATDSEPTVPLRNNIVVSCSHFEVPKKQGGILVSVDGNPLMSGLCSSCWQGILGQLTRLPEAEKLLREVSEWTSPALGPRIREVASEALKWLKGVGK